MPFKLCGPKMMNGDTVLNVTFNATYWKSRRVSEGRNSAPANDEQHQSIWISGSNFPRPREMAPDSDNKPSAFATLLGLAGCEECRFPARQDTREPVDTGVLDNAMACGGNIGNKQERRCQDAEDDIPYPQQAREFSIADGEDSGVVAQHYAIDIRRQRKVIGMRAEDFAPTPADRSS